MSEKNPLECEPELKKETIQSPGGGEVSFCPKRGGIITSLKLGGTEILYFDEETFKDPTKSVRGGIPIMFPNAGFINSLDFPGLKQHGYARTSSQWEVEQLERGLGFSEELSADDNTKQVYPYNTKLRIQGKFENNNSFTILQEVKNLELEKEAPVAMGLHPYFKVPHEEKQNIKFLFKGGDYIKDNIDKWANGEPISINNPKMDDPKASLRIVIPSIGTLIMDVSPEYKKIWVWSLPDKDFVCIEPVMRDVGGLVKDPEMVAPGQTLSAKVNFRLEN